MRRLALVLVVLLLGSLSRFVPGAVASPAPSRSLTVSGTEVTMYPAFDPQITRYAATTTAATAGSLTISASTSDPAGVVLVDGHPETGPTTLGWLAAGDEVSVIFEDAGGRTAYSVMYLPADFPALTATVNVPDQVQPGLIALTPNAFNFGVSQPSFNAIVDRNGVPVYAVRAGMADYDLKQQPNGEITVFRATTAAGHTGEDLVTLDDQLADSQRRFVAAPLTNTDPHDGLRLADGSTVLVGYEKDPTTHLTDATIQKQDPDGTVTFQWTSGPYAAETTSTPPAPTVQDPTPYFDYAHINSVVSVGNGDLIASFRHLSAVFRIATTDHDGFHPGDVIWKLGGRDSTFTFPNDSLGGPCAQHAATELSNGHILLFDNGTSAAFGAPNLCVDPLNRTGPTVPRGFTRVTEYALDTVADTATLVWTYPSDTSRYAFFAGSARRMPNGDTLIGWAADLHAIASEVNTAGDTVWELTAPAPSGPGLQKYMTYRAALITALPDRIAPTVSPGTEDGAVYVLGDTVTPPAYRCADRGGSNLQSCTVTGLIGGRIDTSATGSHSWQVQAADGNGNVTTVVRHYVVRSARQPDARIRKGGATWWRGGDVYGPATHQTVRQRVRRHDSATAFWKVQNDGERADSFRLAAVASNRLLRVHYLVDGVDVTRAVVAGTYVTPTVRPGEVFALKVTLTPTRRASVGDTRTVTMAAVSRGDASQVGRVGSRVTVRR
jgi:hypothetical protein